MRHLLLRHCFGAMLVTSLFAGPSYASNKAVWDACNGVDSKSTPQQEIAACTEIIGDPSESEDHVMMAYQARGMAYYEIGNYVQAIVDVSVAIRLDPQNAIPYISRGRAYAGSGAYDRALADFSEALKRLRTVCERSSADKKSCENGFIGAISFFRGDLYKKKRNKERAIVPLPNIARLSL
jgi:tetratricopeptide (TPR) repeat protein